MKGYNFSQVYRQKKQIGIPKTPLKYNGYMDLIITIVIIGVLSLIMGIILPLDYLPVVIIFAILIGSFFTMIVTNIDKKTGLPAYLLWFYEKRHYAIIYVDGTAYKLQKRKKFLDEERVISYGKEEYDVQ